MVDLVGHPLRLRGRTGDLLLEEQGHGLDLGESSGRGLLVLTRGRRGGGGRGGRDRVHDLSGWTISVHVNMGVWE